MMDLNDVEKPKYGDPNRRHTSAAQLLRRVCALPKND